MLKYYVLIFEVIIYLHIKNITENGNRYEGHWENDVKSGLGRFYHLHTGQLQEGCWVDNLCVKSKMSDINIRQFCELPTKYPIPTVSFS